MNSTHNSPKAREFPLTLDYPTLLAMRDNLTHSGKGGVRAQLFFCGGMRYRWNTKSKNFEITVISYRENGTGPVQIKVPGGCSEKGQTPREALDEEMLTETGRTMDRDAKIIHQRLFRNKANPEIIDHVQIFFIEEMTYKKYNLLFRKKDSEGGEVSPVRWEPITQELVNSFFPSHRIALEKLIKKLLRDCVGDKDKIMALYSIKLAATL